MTCSPQRAAPLREQRWRAESAAQEAKRIGHGCQTCKLWLVTVSVAAPIRVYLRGHATLRVVLPRRDPAQRVGDFAERAAQAPVCKETLRLPSDSLVPHRNLRGRLLEPPEA
jgi:hypothetical protein